MKRKSKKGFVLFLVSLFAPFILYVPRVNAGNENGITVAPAFLKLSVSSQKKTDTAAVSVKNNLPEAVRFAAQVYDVDTVNGTLVPFDTSNSLAAKAVSIDKTEFNLQPGQSINIRVVLSSAILPQGGHYAALFIKRIQTPSMQKTDSINQAVSVGLFLVNEDGVTHKIDQVLARPNGIVFTAPLVHKIVLKNSGNVDEIVHGYVAIKKGSDVYGKKLYSEVSAPLFPGRSLESKATILLEKKMWPGKYTFESSYRYEGQAEPVIEQSTFWYVPLWLPVATIIVLAVCGVSFKHRRIVIKPIKKLLARIVKK